MPEAFFICFNEQNHTYLWKTFLEYVVRPEPGKDINPSGARRSKATRPS